eukprot:m.1158572 g.1158572  ORF g.1158572 m.1158572 type:complete len:336 (-) comp24500_c0_seq17:5748-6755(-)
MMDHTLTPHRSKHPKHHDETSDCNRPVITRKGFLLKWTNIVEGFKRRWFELRYDGCLQYALDVGAKERGFIPVVQLNVEVEKGSSRNFVITHADSGNVFARIRCATEKERVEWITTLELAKEPSRLQSWDTPPRHSPDLITSTSATDETDDATELSEIRRVNDPSSSDGSDDDSDGAPSSEDENVRDIAAIEINPHSRTLADKLQQLVQTHQLLHKSSDALVVKLSFLATSAEEDILPKESTSVDLHNFSFSDEFHLNLADDGDEVGEIEVQGFEHGVGCVLASSSQFVNAALSHERLWMRRLRASQHKTREMEAKVAQLQASCEALRRKITKPS